MGSRENTSGCISQGDIFFTYFGPEIISGLGFIRVYRGAMIVVLILLVVSTCFCYTATDVVLALSSIENLRSCQPRGFLRSLLERDSTSIPADSSGFEFYDGRSAFRVRMPEALEWACSAYLDLDFAWLEEECDVAVLDFVWE